MINPNLVGFIDYYKPGTLVDGETGLPIDPGNPNPPLPVSVYRSFTFVDSDLSLAGVLVKQHDMPRIPATSRVLDPNNVRVIPDEEIDITSNTLSLDMSKFRPLLSGTWRLILFS